MGLFTTVIHIYDKEQRDISTELQKELIQRGFSKIKMLNSVVDEIINYGGPQGLFYLITKQHGNWSTIIELNTNVDDAIYLYEMTQNLSRRLNSYALSFHLHDGDVLFYNLENNGESLDGYNSDPQYFSEERIDKKEIISQRHIPKYFSSLLPKEKNSEELNEILNEGYWTAFDKNELDEDGLPDFEKYYVDELVRFEKIGKYLEIYSATEYPFANWYGHLEELDIKNCIIIHADR